MPRAYGKVALHVKTLIIASYIKNRNDVWIYEAYKVNKDFSQPSIFTYFFILFSYYQSNFISFLEFTMSQLDLMRERAIFALRFYFGSDEACYIFVLFLIKVFWEQLCNHYLQNSYVHSSAHRVKFDIFINEIHVPEQKICLLVRIVEKPYVCRSSPPHDYLLAKI